MCSHSSTACNVNLRRPEKLRCLYSIVYTANNRSVGAKLVLQLQAIKDDGSWIVNDPKGKHTPADNIAEDPGHGAMFYGISCHCCLPSGDVTDANITSRAAASDSDTWKQTFLCTLGRFDSIMVCNVSGRHGKLDGPACHSDALYLLC